jgi:hypothetical protein
MGRSIRSKIGKRLRTVKRQRVDAMIVRPQTQEHHDNLVKVMQGRSVRLSSPKNAFKYPDAEGAVFAQHTIMKPIDFRSSHLPMAGYAFRGNRRKYEGEQKDYMESLALKSHPEMQVMAGGGAILAKTGQRITAHEAQLVATRAERPEAAAMAEANASRASSAVAAAVAEDAEDAMDVPVPGNEELPGRDEADHTRRPVVKDTTRALRNKATPTGNRPRSQAAIKKKAKAGKKN